METQSAFISSVLTSSRQSIDAFVITPIFNPSELSGKLNRVELLVGYEGNAFASTDNASEDLLSITAVHPMRRDAVEDFLRRSRAEWAVVDDLIVRGELVETEHGGKMFYLRKFI